MLEQEWRSPLGLRRFLKGPAIAEPLSPKAALPAHKGIVEAPGIIHTDSYAVLHPITLHFATQLMVVGGQE
jgi:hypothetical protein